jgi:hypothetical protein
MQNSAKNNVMRCIFHMLCVVIRSEDKERKGLRKKRGGGENCRGKRTNRERGGGGDCSIGMFIEGRE